LPQKSINQNVMSTKFIKFTFLLLTLLGVRAYAQVTKLQDYQNLSSATIGTRQGITFREAGFSGLFPIAGTNGTEFWTCSDRGVNVDCANANTASCRPTYDKMYLFPSYAPKIHRIRINSNNTVQILQTIVIKRPNGTPASGILNPTGLGSTAAEVASTDTVLDCSRFNLKTTPKDTFGMDPEGIVVDKEGNFWLCEEGGATIWKVSSRGILLKRYTPYANLPGVQAVDVQIDSVFKYRKNNRGFEGIAITPNGKIYAIIQSPILYPSTSVGENSRIHRILEIDPATNTQRMIVYLNDGIIGASGSNQIRLRDWKIGDMAAINDSTFLVIEAAARGTSDIKRVYQININQATAVTSGLYSGVTLEALVDSTGLANNGIKAVKKTLVMDMLANAWPAVLDKAEGLAIINDSTIAFCNDNDFGQTCPNADGIAIPTTNVSHVITYRLGGQNKLQNYNALTTTLSQGVTGPNSSREPYVVPTVPGVEFTAIISAGDSTSTGYKMTGIPDGAGAFDNGNGTFTMLVNHEIVNTGGVNRAHGARGAFVSKWVINKADLSVVSGSDLISKVNLWNGTGYTLYNPADATSLKAFSRFCSADLPEVSAFYNAATGLGTQERIFMNGEETGSEGRAFAHIASGTNAGTTYELPALGKYSWENAVACPAPQDKTIVAGTDDATPGQVYIYVGTKTNSGTEVEKAGLTNGRLYGVAVAGLTTEVSASFPSPNTVFNLVDLGVVSGITGSALNTLSNNNGVTSFLRPEDGAWDPSNPNDFYFVTTNGFGSPSRMWRLRFSNINNPTAGGTITAVLSGTEGQQMLDNIGIDNYGHILMQEDVGGNSHLGKTWQYTIATDNLIQVGSHDSNRFITGGSGFLTQDEEASGIIDVQGILGAGKFLLVDQAHYSIPGEIFEGGQILAMFNPDTYNSNPEVTVTGNSNTIANGDATPSTTDNTDLGDVNPGDATAKSFVIGNGGPGNLVISNISITGTNAGDFSFVGAPSLPLTIGSNVSQSITVQFLPSAIGTRTAQLNIQTNDFDEANYTFALQGNGTCTSYASVINVSPSPTVAGQLPNTIYLGYGPQSVKLTASVPAGFPQYSYSWSPVSSSDSAVTVSPTTTTTYTVQVTNAYGCTSSVSQTIQVIDIRDLPHQNKVFICHNGNNTLSIGKGAVPDHLGHGDQLGKCDVSSAPGGNASGINDDLENSQFRIHPNPSSGNTTLLNLNAGEVLEITVTDIQ
jgi:hypothetical protein